MHFAFAQDAIGRGRRVGCGNASLSLNDGQFAMLERGINKTLSLHDLG